MKQLGVKLNMIVETELSVDDFNEKFLDWIDANGWLCSGDMQQIDENCNIIDNKQILDI